MLKLGMGSVQWGTNYGIANRTGMPDSNTVASILRLAKAAGVVTLDTAAAYGSAEDLLGSESASKLGFEIVTKTIPLRGMPVRSATAAQQVRDRFMISLEKLGAPMVFGFLVHHAADLLAGGGDLVWGVLSGLRREGLVKKIGCSVYHPSELMQLLDRYDLDLIQVPLNVYDQRFLRSGALAAAKKLNVEIHVRSVFLQGLLLMQSADLPAQFDAIRAHHSRFHQACRLAGVSPLQGAIEFVTQCALVDKVIVGCERIEQFQEILDAAGSAPSSMGGDDAFHGLVLDDEAYTNPGRWLRNA